MFLVHLIAVVIENYRRFMTGYFTNRHFTFDACFQLQINMKLQRERKLPGKIHFIRSQKLIEVMPRNKTRHKKHIDIRIIFDTIK